MTRPSNRRLTLDDMQNSAAEHGGRCLSSSYHNVGTKLEWECDQGHRWFASANQIRRGSWCPVCARQNQNTQRRYTIKNLKSIARRRKGFCLSPAYLGSHARHRWRCKNGHEWEATASSVIEGSWCPICASETRRNGIEFMRSFARSHGWNCLSEHCASNQERLQWSCLKGHQWKSTYNYLSSHPYCPVCHKEERRFKNLEHYRKIARRHGGECLSDSFVSLPGKMRWRCRDGHEWLATHSQIKAGHWCPECKQAQRRIGIGRMCEIAVERGGECLSEHYRNQTEPLRWRCAQGHEWEASYASIRLNSWCPVCASAKQTGRATAKIADLREWAAQRGGWCLSYRYRNNKEPLLWECREGHRFTRTWRRVRAGAWCPHCKTEEKRWIKRRKNADRLSRTDGFLAAAGYLADCHGGVCRSEEYHGNRGALQQECVHGHRWTSDYYTLRRGSWCPVCADKQRQESRRIHQGILLLDDEDELIHYACSIGCEWVGDTIVKLGRNHLFSCVNGHLWESADPQSRSVCWCPCCGQIGTALGKSRIVR